jgi:hypothetical protein
MLQEKNCFFIAESSLHLLVGGLRQLRDQFPSRLEGSGVPGFQSSGAKSPAWQPEKKIFLGCYPLPILNFSVE